MKDIAQMTGLSIATVSHALNGTRKVSDKSMKLIQDAAEEIGYRPSLAAQIMRTQKSGIVGLILPSSHPTNDTNSFYFGVLNGARAALDARGYDMIVSTYPEESDEVDFSSLQVLQKRIVDGVLLVPHSADANALSSLDNLNVPLILLDRKVEKTTYPTVRSDNYKISQQLVEHFVNGNRKSIAFLGGKTSYSTVRERLEGYQTALKQAGKSIKKELILTGCSDKEEEGYQGIKRLLEHGADAVFVENATLMIGVMAYCQENNIDIPEQLAIAGFDNASWMNITTPPLTAVQQSAEGIGEKGANLLIDCIEEKPVESNDIIIPAELILRKSHN